MFGLGERGAVALGLAAAACVSAGAWAGMDASRDIAGFYYASPPVTRPEMVTVRRAPLSWDRLERPIAAAPSPGLVWGEEVGREERAFFDLGPAEREEPVRVFRGGSTRGTTDVEAEPALEGAEVSAPRT